MFVIIEYILTPKYRQIIRRDNGIVINCSVCGDI